MSDERGLVVSTPIEISDDSVRFKGMRLDPQALRANLLFWDKLDFPHRRFDLFQYPLDPDAEFLFRCGILQRTPVSMGGKMPDIVAQAQVGAFRYLDEREPGKWSLATGEGSISFPESDLEVGRGALVRLHRAIPVPDKDVPLHDILMFREKRRSELLALRHHLESNYQRVLAAADGELAINTEIEALQAAIADHIRASKEMGFKFRAVSLNASLNLVEGATVGVGALALGLPAVAALMMAAGAAINIGPGTALTWGKPTGTPFQYISAYHEEVF